MHIDGIAIQIHAVQCIKTSDSAIKPDRSCSGNNYIATNIYDVHGGQVVNTHVPLSWYGMVY